MGSWCLIESDPGVFTELIRDIGVQDVQVEELWGLDEDTLRQSEPVYGLIFLFKWRKSDKDVRPCVKDAPGVFFANQVITNACATQAILSILLNAPSSVHLGDELTNFQSFTADMDAEMRGLAISNSDTIRRVHNSFTRHEGYATDDLQQQAKDDEVYHFISYVPRCGHLWEIDGLKEGPIDHGECSMDDWLAKVLTVLQERMGRYAAEEVHFNLLAVIKDRKVVAQERMETLSTRQNVTDDAERRAIDDELRALSNRIVEEDEKRARYHTENTRRRFNYVPFIMAALKVLATKGSLASLVQQSKDKAKDHFERQK